MQTYRLNAYRARRDSTDSAERCGSGRPGKWCSIWNRSSVKALPAVAWFGLAPQRGNKTIAQGAASLCPGLLCCCPFGKRLSNVGIADQVAYCSPKAKGPCNGLTFQTGQQRDVPTTQIIPIAKVRKLDGVSPLCRSQEKPRCNILTCKRLSSWCLQKCCQFG